MTDARTVPCTFCGGPNSLERVEIGYEHCTRRECIALWKGRRLDDSGLALVLMHKQGFAWVQKDQVAKNDMKRAGGA